MLEDTERFDAKFFGVNPKEALGMDPQHRVFLECAHQAQCEVLLCRLGIPNRCLAAAHPG